MLQLFQDHSVLILGTLLGLSEILALIPAIKSNSVLLLIINSLKSLLGKSA